MVGIVDKSYYVEVLRRPRFLSEGYKLLEKLVPWKTSFTKIMPMYTSISEEPIL